VKILLDECTPRLLKRRITGHSVCTVQEMGWAGVKNGELLLRLEGQFDVFVTTDKNLRHQQNLTGRDFAVLLLPSNQVPIVAALIPDIEAALQSARPGDFIEIPYPPT
jgi:Domain of unknown function (DUF5615)